MGGRKRRKGGGEAGGIQRGVRRREKRRDTRGFKRKKAGIEGRRE